MTFVTNKEAEISEKHVVNGYAIEELPTEALPLGTLCRTKRFDRLGVIVDAFYGEKDQNGNKIIFYTVLSFPEQSKVTFNQDENPYFLSNEYEYDIIGYLMLKPIDISIFSSILRDHML
tara:strand:- start:1119 stop:1475 length:357 start_codon:yes stop_codon:yes gene_type:complete